MVSSLRRHRFCRLPGDGVTGTLLVTDGDIVDLSFLMGVEGADFFFVSVVVVVVFGFFTAKKSSIVGCGFRLLGLFPFCTPSILEKKLVIVVVFVFESSLLAIGWETRIASASTTSGVVSLLPVLGFPFL